MCANLVRVNLLWWWVFVFHYFGVVTWNASFAISFSTLCRSFFGLDELQGSRPCFGACPCVAVGGVVPLISSRPAIILLLLTLRCGSDERRLGNTLEVLPFNPRHQHSVLYAIQPAVEQSLPLVLVDPLHKCQNSISVMSKQVSSWY